MQYYPFELDTESQDLFTIVMPFGICKYARLRMGLKCSRDIAQAAMENAFAGINDADFYTEDVGACSSTREHHHDLLHTILQRLCEMALPLTHSSASGRSKNLIGLVTGLHLMVKSL